MKNKTPLLREASAGKISWKTESFAESKGSCYIPDKKDMESYEKFMDRYRKGLAIERAVVNAFE